MKKVSSIQNLKPLPWLTSALQLKSDVKLKKVESYDSTQNPLVKEIFAPDPLTGFPSGDLRLVLNNNTAPEVKAFIQDMMKPVNPPVGSPDIDSCPNESITAQFGVEKDVFLSEITEFTKELYHKNVKKNE